MKNFTPRKPVFQPETNTYLIPLTRGYETVVDAIDVDLADYGWITQPAKRTVYAYKMLPRVNGKQKLALLHRVILSRMLGRELAKSELVDHANGNGLDNTRANLRIATHAQNMANQRKATNNTSGYKGVSWEKTTRKWQCHICVNRKQIHLGRFTSPEAAHEAYVKAARQHFGEFANDGE